MRITKVKIPKQKGEGVWRRILCLCLLVTFLLTISAAVSADEIIVNGVPGGTIPGATSSASGAYDIYDDDGYTLGFRFTLVDANNELIDDPRDVYENSYFSAFLKNHSEVVTMYDSALSVKVKLSKMDYIGMYASSPTYNYVLTNSTSASDHVDNSTSFLDSTIGVSLPATAAEMVDWPGIENVSVLVPALWNVELETMISKDYRIAVEPIYAVRIGGEYFALTVTEIAINAVIDGTAYSGTPSWTAMTSSSSNTTSFQRLTQYTHGTWPMQLTLKSDAFGITGVTSMRDLGPTPQTARGTAKEIIEGKYGIMEVSAEGMQIFTLKVDPNGGTWNSSTETQIFTLKKGDTKTIPVPTRDGYTFSGWSVSGGGSLSGTTYTQGSSNCTITARWEKNSYTDTINHWLGGLENSEGNNSAKTMYKLGSTTFSANVGDTFPLDSDYCCGATQTSSGDYAIAGGSAATGCVEGYRFSDGPMNMLLRRGTFREGSPCNVILQ